MAQQTIHVSELAKLGQVDLIDVRTPAEFRECHAQGAQLVPLSELKPSELMKGRESAPVYLICKSGTRAGQARAAIEAAGYSNAVVVEGGTQAWVAAGLPVVRGKQTMSLERQVRIAAGSLVAVGTALGAFVNPLFLILPGFVGCGLVFAGITDTCGMGMALARMPWNQVRNNAETCDASVARS